MGNHISLRLELSFECKLLIYSDNFKTATWSSEEEEEGLGTTRTLSFVLLFFGKNFPTVLAGSAQKCSSARRW